MFLGSHMLSLLQVKQMAWMLLLSQKSIVGSQNELKILYGLSGTLKKCTWISYHHLHPLEMEAGTITRDWTAGGC